METDSSSFASILANVAKMRQREGDDNSGQEETVSFVSSEPERSKSTFDRVIDAPSLRPAQNEASVRVRPTKDLSPQVVIRGSNQEDKLVDSAKYTTLKKQTFSAIQINQNQTGNPLLQSLKQVPYEFNAKVKDVDYLINSHCVVVFLSLRYHKLHPEYIYNKIKKITYNGNNRRLNRILMVLVDVDNSNDSIRELNKLCLFNELNLVLAWSFQQCADYLTFLKQCELNVGNQLIKGAAKADSIASDVDYYQRIVDLMTTIRSINKTDSIKLISRFKTFKNLCEEANEYNLEEISGMGHNKIERLLKVINDPFIYK
ncbi:hypothetical protein KL930_000583 [Ogataea haglerorum]|uniref:ERCC1-like central domain-containing protein n=1 Tax=Ogataea haglerorum TaxID=1937702 RepID=A0AAN6DAX9_9ASCO|nr:uncharacterized protein KL911_005324 [Ogataea haglerorum]KAG7701554.1 hypothetical protein KL951_000010 [Ogataea haglerorum]KAG7711368.1 hypothetical protein KL914_000010 [Ogataea haglerorum]KAG7712139.1 hypothetical protein KL950_000010 [Ogataea haglerorum]KAG7722190.1 hypothetical protein KL913_000010 [Ogataea haglerorum]KAG7723707.1 hypothetical protein KL949_000757 [Ogataea haglerorum]